MVNARARVRARSPTKCKRREKKSLNRGRVVRLRRSSEPPAGEGVSKKMRQFEALLVPTEASRHTDHKGEGGCDGDRDGAVRAATTPAGQGRRQRPLTIPGSSLVGKHSRYVCHPTAIIQGRRTCTSTALPRQATQPFESPPRRSQRTVAVCRSTRADMAAPVLCATGTSRRGPISL